MIYGSYMRHLCVMSLCIFALGGCRLVVGDGCVNLSLNSQTVARGCPSTPPVITLNGAATVNTFISSIFVDPGAAVADDDPNYGGEVMATITNVNGMVVSMDVLNSTVGTYTITYIAPPDAEDSAPTSVTRTVVVAESDTIAPVITLNGAATINLFVDDSYDELGATVTDNDFAYTGTATPAGAVDTTTIGTYIVTYTAPADAAGNAPTSVTRMVVVVADIAAPIITLNGVATINLRVGGSYDELGGTVADNNPVYTGTVVLAGAVDTTTIGTYTITYTAPDDAAGNAAILVTRTVNTVPNVDTDGDLLIDISTLEDLDNVHKNLEGTSSFYTTATGVSINIQCGSDADTACQGYELMNDLDFADPNSYVSGVVNDDWRPQNAGGVVVMQNMAGIAVNTGWPPIGDCNNDTSDSGDSVCTDDDDTPFFTLFEGNGNRIANLYARDTGTDDGNAVGFFRITDSSSQIRNLGLVTPAVYGRGDGAYIGALVGYNRSSIVASYATDVTVSSDDVPLADIGGLVGFHNGRFLIASYVTGDVIGGISPSSGYRIGGLVGLSSAAIGASYSFSAVSGRSAALDFIGGLVGLARRSNIIGASYATSDILSNTGDDIGFLVGGNVFGSIISASYGFGVVMGGMTNNTHGTPPTSVTSANGLTLGNAGSTWNAAARNTLGAWDFGTASQPPALLYNDYDGTGEDFACSNAPNPPVDAIIVANCGTLIPGQR